MQSNKFNKFIITQKNLEHCINNIYWNINWFKNTRICFSFWENKKAFLFIIFYSFTILFNHLNIFNIHYIGVGNC